MKKFTDSMLFTGGAEPTPIVVVSKFSQPGSLNNGEPTLIIRQEVSGYVVEVTLSPETMKSIIAWYES